MTVSALGQSSDVSDLETWSVANAHGGILESNLTNEELERFPYLVKNLNCKEVSHIYGMMDDDNLSERYYIKIREDLESIQQENKQVEINYIDKERNILIDKGTEGTLSEVVISNELQPYNEVPLNDCKQNLSEKAAENLNTKRQVQ